MRGHADPPKKDSASSAPPPDMQKVRRVAGNLNPASKVWTFTEDNRVLLVEIPRDITKQEWEVLNQYVQFISPKEEIK